MNYEAVNNRFLVEKTEDKTTFIKNMEGIIRQAPEEYKKWIGKKVIINTFNPTFFIDDKEYYVINKEEIYLKEI